MIDYADKDRDGGINYDEFLNVLTKEYPKIWSSIALWLKDSILTLRFNIYIEIRHYSFNFICTECIHIFPFNKRIWPRMSLLD